MFDQHINEEIDQFVDAKKQIIRECRTDGVTATGSNQ